MNRKKRILSLCLIMSMVLCNLFSLSFYSPLDINPFSHKNVQAATTDTSITASVTNATLTDNIYSVTYITVLFATQNLTNTTYQINNCNPVPFTDEIELAIGKDTAYGEITTIRISGISTIDSKSEKSKTFTYQRSANPIEEEEQDNTLSVRVKRSQFADAPYLYLYNLEGVELLGIWPGTRMVAEGDYYIINTYITEEVHAVLNTSDDTYIHDTLYTDSPISGKVEFDRVTEKYTPYTIASDYGTVTVKYQNEGGIPLKTITRVGELGTPFYVYAPEMLSTFDNYVLSSSLSEQVAGIFTEEDQYITFTYTGKTVATPTPTEVPTPTPTEVPTPTPTEVPTPTPTEVPTPTPTEVPTPTPTEVPTPTPTEVPTPTPMEVPTPTPMEMPTAIPTDIPTSIPEVVQTPTVPNIVITMEPTAVPEPTAYAPLSVDGTRYTVTLHPRGGTLGKSTLSVIQGNLYGTLPIPSRTGYTFEGWFTSMEEGQQPITKDSLVNLAEDQDLYAKWKANIYTITFDADGGMVDVTSFPVTYGQTYPELPIPHKENALFSGWYTQDGTYVNEYNIFNIASDLTLTAEWQTAFRRADIGPLSFSFENSSVGFSYEDNYRPRLEIYQYIYGNTLKAKKMFTQQSTWSGSCFGMGAAALFFYVGTTDNLQYDDFNASARAINQLEPTDVNQNLNLSLTKLIEVMHVIQHDSYILSKRDKNMNQLDTLCEKVMDSQENKGNPILIYMWGVDDKGNAGGHAVIGYNLVNGLLYIYDPNYPSDASRYITIGKDANGNSTWSYKLNKQYDWGTGQERAAISFVTYEDLKQGWEQCRMFQYAIGKSGTNSLILSTKNANIYNSNGVLMASIIEGELESKYEDICKIIPNTVVNSQSASSLEIHLPSGEYIIENTDPFSTEFTAEMMNLQQCATVTTQAKKVTVCVNDEERTNFVICHANENQTYSIRLESSIEGDKESIERTGTGNSNHYIGVSQSEGVEKELHYVKNTPISYPVTISANEGGTVTCNETAVSSSEQEPLQATYGTNLTFAITPNEGYVISNVFVDDTDMGPVATYMLENITAAHSIRIVFSPKTVDTTKPKIQLTVDQLPSFNYTGKEILPSVTVRSGELILEENIDYIAHYRNNTKVGTAYVDIIGINAYNGLEATTISFKILPAKGKIYTINGLKYKLTDLKGKKVTLTGVSKKTLSSVTIMKEIKIGNTSYKVTTIGAKAFENCKKLKKIVISNTELKAIGKNAFKGISSKAVIKVPASKYKVYTKLLKNKGQSKTVLIKK